MTDFNSEIMRIDFWAQLNLFNLISVLVLFGFLVLLCLFVAELAKIDQSTNRGSRVWSDLNQVNCVGSGHGQGLTQRKNAKLLSVHTNDADFAGADFAVNPDKRTGRSRRTWRERATQDTLDGLNLFMHSFENHVALGLQF